MSDLFTQQGTMPELFKTGEDIAEELKSQTVEPNTATDLLLNGDSKPNRFSRQCAENEEPDADLTENLLHDEKSNKNTITGTNTPRSSRASAYYDLLRSQHKNGHYKAPAYRVVDAIESPLQAGAGALNYHDDFDTDAIQNAGLHMAVAQTVVEGNIMAAAADSAFVIGKQTGNILKDLKDETINAKGALKAGGQVLRLQGGKSIVKIGGATLRSTEQYLSSFQVSTDDFTGSVPGKVKEAATNTGNILKKITNVVLHPLRNLIAMGRLCRKSTTTAMQRLPRASIRHSRMTLTPMAVPMGTIRSPGSAAIICSMVSLGTMPMASTMTRQRSSLWQRYITSRIGRVRSLCLLSATIFPLQNSAVL